VPKHHPWPAKAFGWPSQRKYPLMNEEDDALVWDYDMAVRAKAEAGKDLDQGLLTRRQYQTILQNAEYAMSQSKPKVRKASKKAAKKTSKKAAKKAVRKAAKKSAKKAPKKSSKDSPKVVRFNRPVKVKLLSEESFVRKNPASRDGGTMLAYPPEAPQFFDSNAGSMDEIYVLPEEKVFYVLSFNTSKGYVDLETFDPETGIKTGEAYTDDPDEIAKILPQGMATPPGLMFVALRRFVGAPDMDDED